MKSLNLEYNKHICSFMDKSIYKSLGEWQSKEKSAYKAAKKLGLLDDICKQMGWSKTIGKWDLEACIEKAKLCASKMEMKRKFPGAYDSIYRNNWGHLCFLEFSNLHRDKWSDSELIESAKLYNTQKEWISGNYASYQAARKRKEVFQKSISHMDRRNTYSLEECKKDALKYNTLGDWRTNSEYLYKAACRNKWLKECIAHLKKYNFKTKTYE